MTKKRLIWVDVVKGFLMLLVVAGHYPGELNFPLATYIYWFHMPAFFLLSGMFFKPALEKGQFKSTMYKRFMQLIIPYLFFILLITVIRYGMEIASGNVDLTWYVQDLLTILVGGRFARGAYGVVWFVTTLFVTYLLFLLITKYFTKFKQIILIAAMYLIAHVEGFIAMQVIGGAPDEASQQIPMLWNIDVAFMAIAYFAIGYYLKEFWTNITKPWLIGGLITITTAIILSGKGILDYHLSLKFLRYEHVILDLLIPLACIVVLLWVFQQLQKWMSLNWLQVVNKHSIAIMYLHLLVNQMMDDYFTYGLIGYVLFGVIIPIVASITIQNVIPYGKLLLGGFNPKRQRYETVQDVR